ncbi:GreA/GreB family elongation factor [Colwellia asteriadis]|uniref:GreA/GreB family elongation factor n=1 Tax=Colwellia asteriadis TaxID=517723 RepID=A0ABN1LAR8_9GAMM
MHKTSSFNKQQLIAVIIADLQKELLQAQQAANEAHAAAVDDESVAETQYDTLAIEASYLAEGQSRRVQEYRNAIDELNALSCKEYSADDAISLSALVQLAQDSESNSWFFIAPAAGGFRCTIANRNITVITAKSPMGMALLGKYQDDDIAIMLGNNSLNDYIKQVC